MYKLCLLVCMFSTASFAEKIPSIDFDGDGPDYKECELSDKKLKCEDQIDNCLFVKNENQYVNPYYDGDEDKALGTACDYDIDGDGIPATYNDALTLRHNINSYLFACRDSVTDTWRSDGICDPTLNNIGDLTGVLMTNAAGADMETTTDGRLTPYDWCAISARNPSLKLQFESLFNYTATCNSLFNLYTVDGLPK